MTPAQHARAALCGTLIVLSLAVFCIPLAVLACARLASRSPALRRAMNGLYRAAVALDDWYLLHIGRVRWQLPVLGLDPDGACIVLCNHRSWSDIFVVQSVVAKTGPVIVFLTKRELAYIPILGIICWAFGFPLLRRRARGARSEAERREADRQRVREACAAVRRAPAAILTFAEGTRFTAEKHARSASPFRHLLAPRPGGFAAICASLADLEPEVVDMTLAYQGPLTLWRFLGGATPVTASASLASYRELRDGAERWLLQRWAVKDRLLNGPASADSAEAGESAEPPP